MIVALLVAILIGVLTIICQLIVISRVIGEQEQHIVTEQSRLVKEELLKLTRVIAEVTPSNTPETTPINPFTGWPYYGPNTPYPYPGQGPYFTSESAK